MCDRLRCWKVISTAAIANGGRKADALFVKRLHASGALVVEAKGTSRECAVVTTAGSSRLMERFVHAEFDGVANFRAKDNLPRGALDRWGPFLFCNLNPALSLTNSLGR
jgi:hypothetical protein